MANGDLGSVLCGPSLLWCIPSVGKEHVLRWIVCFIALSANSWHFKILPLVVKQKLFPVKDFQPGAKELKPFRSVVPGVS